MYRLPIVALPLAMAVVLFGRVIFHDENFIYRDAGHFYYPLFKLVTDEIRAGRVPLWNPWEDSGQPLAANPTASVFYPLKGLFLVLPFPVAYKTYTLVHVLLCFGSAWGLLRHWQLGSAAATFGALAYAFGGYVLFQYCNIVFLCGAAWLPLVLLAGQQAMRGRSGPWVIGLGLALAMTVLSGDPQAGYLAGLMLVVWAVLTWGETDRLSGRRLGAGLAVLVILPALFVSWKPIPTGTTLRVLGLLVLIHAWWPNSRLSESRGPRRTALALAGTVLAVAALLWPSGDVFLAGPAEHDRYAALLPNGERETLNPKELLARRQAHELGFQRWQLTASGVGLLVWTAVMRRRLSGTGANLAGGVGLAGAACLLIGPHLAAAASAWPVQRLYLALWLVLAVAVLMPLAIGLGSTVRGSRPAARRLGWAALLTAVLWVGLATSVGQRVHEFNLDVQAAIDAFEPPLDREAFWRSEVPSWIVRFLGAPLVLALGVFWTDGRREPARPVGAAWKPLAALGAGVLVALLVSAVQIGPSWEYARYSLRSVSDEQAPRSPYAFSEHPLRLAEYLVPNISGRLFPDNSMWINWLDRKAEIWTPTKYMGLAVLLLAGVGLAQARRPTVGWLAIMLLASVAAGLGKHLNLYAIWHEALPGLALFRYPAKLLVLTALALAGLGAQGFQQVFAGPADEAATARRRRRVLAAAVAVGLLAGLGAALTWTQEPAIKRWMYAHLWAANLYGPPHVEGAIQTIQRALVQTTLVAAVLAVLLAAAARAKRRRPVWSAAAVGLLAVDLWAANAWIVVTGPQALFETKPEIVEAIEQDAAQQGYREPYRIHRTEIYEPLKFLLTRPTDPGRRPVEATWWEAQTLQPKYGLLHRVAYVYTIGTISLYDYAFFFGPFFSPSVTLPSGKRIVYYPRRSFDIWNTRYFVLPREVVPDHEYRGILAFLTDLQGNPMPVILKSPGEPNDTDDYQVVRNTDAFPRTWIVHQARVIPAIRRQTRQALAQVMDLLIYKGDALWRDPTRQVLDLAHLVLIEKEPGEPLPTVAEPPTGSPDEWSCVAVYEPPYVCIQARLEAPGWLVLADAWYPGWECRVDGRRQPIERANRMMRAVHLGPGRHTVEFRYRPLSFRAGLGVTLAALAAVMLTLAGYALNRRHASVRGGAFSP